MQNAHRHTGEQTRVQNETSTDKGDEEAAAGEETLAGHIWAVSTSTPASLLQLLREPPECFPAVHDCEWRTSEVVTVQLEPSLRKAGPLTPN